MQQVADVEARVKLTTLLDFYGPLLTEHRREVMRLHCEEDLSLAEIAEQLSITRQGVNDAVQKARRQLFDYEEKLGLAQRYRAVEDAAESALDALDEIEESDSNRNSLVKAKSALNQILQIER